MENSINPTNGVYADLLSTQSNSHSVVLFQDESLIRLLSYCQGCWSVCAHLAGDEEEEIFEFNGIVYASCPVLTYVEFTIKQLCSVACTQSCRTCPVASVYKDLKHRSSADDIEMMSIAMNAVFNDLL